MHGSVRVSAVVVVFGDADCGGVGCGVGTLTATSHVVGIGDSRSVPALAVFLSVVCDLSLCMFYFAHNVFYVCVLTICACVLAHTDTPTHSLTPRC